jgi:hypothetical protein
VAKKRKSIKKTQTLLPKLKKKVRLKSLNPQYQPRVRKELVDFDYLDKLNPAEKEYLAQFVDESIGASVRKLKSGKIAAGQLHNTEALAKECYDANNRRNNDVYSVTKANGLLYDIKHKMQMEETDLHINYHLTEEATIAMIENDEQDILTFQEFIDLRGNLNPEIRAFYVKHYAKELRTYFKGLKK